ncbi:hypothetical protein JXA32_01940 [Candidatus Sumerlaeota bacterium]|nr:hypothetical protein [Candidatus Sumerlaeota bacterium]
MKRRTRLTSVLIIALSGILALFGENQARASRIPPHMWRDIGNAELIVIANVGQLSSTTFQTPIEIVEVLMGDPGMKNQTVQVPLEIHQMLSCSSADYRLPYGATSVAILFRKDWRTTEHWPISQGFTKPEDIENFRTLIEIYQQPDEKIRIAKFLPYMKKSFREAGWAYQQGFEELLRSMKEPSNFPLAIDICRQAHPDNQSSILCQLASTGDKRTIPLLLDISESPNNEIARLANRLLLRYFPDVADASNISVKRPLAQYKITRVSDMGFWTGELVSQPGGGKLAKKEKKKYYLDMFHDEKEPSGNRLIAGEMLIPLLTEKEKTSICNELLAMLPSMYDEDHPRLKYSVAFLSPYAARMLRAIRLPECQEPLLAILNLKNSVSEAMPIATWAVVELGSEACEQAASQNLNNIQEWLNGNRGSSVDSLMQLLYSLAYVGDAQHFRIAEEYYQQFNKMSRGPYFERIQPWIGLSSADDEAAMLIEILETILNNEPNLQASGIYWIVTRMGELQDRRTVPILLECLDATSKWGGNPTNKALFTTFTRLNCAETENGMLSRLTHEDENIRLMAMKTLYEFQGEQYRKLLRRMISEDDFGLKWYALEQFAEIGQPDDLELLLPLCGFWSRDPKQIRLRSLQERAIEAVALIRQRNK